MTKLYGILLIACLVAISGVIAYVGDIVGRRMGRKRLSLFGMRPRHTAIAISVISGMLITVLTLSVAALVSRDVKDGLFRVVEMRLAQAKLAREIETLAARADAVDQQRKAAEQQVSESRAELKRTEGVLQQMRDELRQQQQKLTTTSAQLRAAKGEVTRAEGALNRQEAIYRSLTQLKRKLEEDVQRATRALQFATRAAEYGRSAPVLVGAGQALASDVVQGGQPVEKIRSQLDQLVDRVDRQASAAGAGADPNTKRAVVIRHLVTDEQTKTVTYALGDQVVAAVADEIHQASGGIIVRLNSLFNTTEGEPVYADFQLFNNRLVYRKGDLLADTIIDGRLSEPALMAALVGLLKDEVGMKARQQNIMPRIAPLGTDASSFGRGAVGEMSYEDLFANIAALRQAGGPARVRAVAAQDTWTAGPLEVEFGIQPVSEGGG